MPEPTKVNDPNDDQKPQDPLFAVFPGLTKKDQAAWIAAKSIDEPYKPSDESMTRENAPRGEVTQYRWKSELVYPGTERDYWVLN